MTDRAFAARQGIAPVTGMSLFSRRVSVVPSHADWLRGAVAALLPRGWRFDILEGVDGRAQLMLVGYDAEP